MQNPPDKLPIQSIIMDTPLGALLLSATARGLCLAHFTRSMDLHPWSQASLADVPHVSLAENSHNQYSVQFSASLFKSGNPQGADAHLWQACEELAEYFSGTRKVFTCKTKVWGTPFQEEVWRELNTIPYAQTVAYSDVAQAIGRPSAVRAVANAIGKNPVAIIIPCHRVIGKDGSLTGYASGIERKNALLQLEKKA